jgi:hypothetical protein
MTQRPEITVAEARQAKLIFFSCLAIGGVLLVALALPSILERVNG